MPKVKNPQLGVRAMDVRRLRDKKKTGSVNGLSGVISLFGV